MSIRIHIVGSGPRCGTTLLFEAMRVCFNIDNASDKEKSICVSNHALGGGKIILSKSPAEINLVDSLLTINKKLFVVCIIRDPRDMISSFHGGHLDDYWASLRYWKKFMKFYHKLVRSKRFILIRYEDFVTNPDDIQEYISSKINMLQSLHKFSEYHLHTKLSEQSKNAMHGLRPIQAKGLGNWRNHLPRIKQQISIHGDITESLKTFKYEVDDSWRNLLKDEEGIDYQTRTGEFFTKKRIKRDKNKKIIALLNTLLERVNLNPDKILFPFKFVFNKLRE